MFLCTFTFPLFADTLVFPVAFFSFVQDFWKSKKNPTAAIQFCWAGPIYCSTSDSLTFGRAFNCFWAYGKLSPFYRFLKSGSNWKSLFFWPVCGVMIHHLLFFTLVGGGSSPGGPATPGRPPGEEAEWAERGKKMPGRPFSFFRCWHQRLRRALQQGPGGSEGEREAAPTG